MSPTSRLQITKKVMPVTSAENEALLRKLRERIAGGEVPLVVDASTLQGLMVAAFVDAAVPWVPLAAGMSRVRGAVGTLDRVHVVLDDPAGHLRAYYEIKRERDALEQERDALRAERDALLAERDAHERSEP